jgi:hypothetical protein
MTIPTRNQTTAQPGRVAGLVISEVAACTSMTMTTAIANTIMTTAKATATPRSVVDHAASRARMLTRRCQRIRSRHRHKVGVTNHGATTQLGLSDLNATITITWGAKSTDALECHVKRQRGESQHACWHSITAPQNHSHFSSHAFRMVHHVIEQASISLEFIACSGAEFHMQTWSHFR